LAAPPTPAPGADDAARPGVGHVLLADMHAVAVELYREVGPVVHEEGHAALLADRPQGVGGARDGGVVYALQTQLEGRDIALVECRPEFVREDRRMLDAFGRDEVKTAGWSCQIVRHAVCFRG